MGSETAPSEPDNNRTRPPGHIAIIMDGNGRWAKSRKLPRIAGHRAGVKTVDRIVTHCRTIGVEALTLYSFSSENWHRPADEVGALMGILKEYLLKELRRMVKEDIRFNTIGDLAALPDFAREAVEKVTEETRNNSGMILTLALSYGSRDEIVAATKKLAKQVADNELKPENITEQMFSGALDTTPLLPDPDLLIRTSGELRISNFLLWQIAYSELHFTDTLWPDFTEDDLDEAIASYHQRERRYGKTGEQISDGSGQTA